MSKTENISINYDPEEVDLKEQMRQLAAQKGTRYENRGYSEIGRIALTEWLAKELGKLKKSDGTTG